MTKYEQDIKNNYKICNQCKLQLSLSEFYIRKITNGQNAPIFKPKCIKCTHKEQTIYRKENADFIKKYRKDNKNKIKLSSDKYRAKNKEKLKQKNKEWYAKNKEYRKQYIKQYYQKQKNKDKLNKRLREKRKNDINYKLISNLRNKTNKVFRGKLKQKKTIEFIGCSLEEFKQYIESKWLLGMSWDNYGRSENQWSLDHIIPCQLFDFSNPIHQKIALHYTNLRPLWHLDNITKNDILPDKRFAQDLTKEEKDLYIKQLVGI